jgi:hypothetical protein
MKGKEVEKYITRDLGFIPRHDCEALAAAITDIATEIDADEQELMELLLNNKPINSLMTHSYGFHTANGREIINNLKGKYYEYN